MCKSKMAAKASSPKRIIHRSNTPPTPLSPATVSESINYSSSSTNTSSSYKLGSSTATTSNLSRTSLSSLRQSLPESPIIYPFSEIRSSTNNFLSKPLSSSSSWKCTLRDKNVIVSQRKLLRPLTAPLLNHRLSILFRTHHSSIVKLLGASLSGEYIYLVYDFVPGASLSDCLRNSRNSNFTVLSTWMSRVQVAADVASGIDYIHNNTGLSGISTVHKHIKSSSVIVTEPGLHAKICHFGAAELCGETAKKNSGGEIEEMKRSGSRGMQFEGVRGYMSPEFRETGIATQKSDVYAFGVVLLELLSGEEPVRYRFDRTSGDYQRISLIETAEYVVDCSREEVEMRLRRWIDGRLKDSFPVDVVEKLVRLALECVHVEADKRPDMQRVAGKISKLYLQSKDWSDRVKVPTEISVSLGPR